MLSDTHPCLPCLLHIGMLTVQLLHARTTQCTCCTQGNNYDGYSSGEDSRSGSTYSRPTFSQDAPARSPLTSTTYAAASPSSRQGGAGGGAGGAGDESQLVDDMCAPQGLRAQPDREALRTFVENAASMNGPTVAQHLQTKMVSPLSPSSAVCALLNVTKACTP